MKKLLWIDCETTGTDPSLHSIIEVAGIIDIDGKKVDDFDFKVKPHEDFEINPQSIATHGITEEEMKGFPSIEETHKLLTAKWGKYVDKYNKNDKFIVAGQNVKFDIDMLVNFFYRIGDNYLGSYIDFRKRIELLDLTRSLQMLGFIKSDNLRLEVICKELGVEINAHNALSDIEATRSVYYMILEHLKWG